MKLSEIKGERAIEVIADLIEPVASIAEDKTASQIFKREKPPKGVSPRAFAVARLRKHIPALLKDHKKDLVTVLSVLEGVSYDEYAQSLTLAKVIKDLTELLTDEDFVAFFTSAQSGKPSGSAPENSEDIL